MIDRETQLYRIVQVQMRSILVTFAYYNKGRKADAGLFDIVDPDEEADIMIRTLRDFGFLEPAKDKSK